MEGIFSGKLIKTTHDQTKVVQTGPLPMPKWDDPVTQVMGKMEATFPYEANGAIECRPDRVQFLGS
jgi:hypothetical protein